MRRGCIISYCVPTVLGVSQSDRTGNCRVLPLESRVLPSRRRTRHSCSLSVNVQAANAKRKMCSLWLKSNAVRAFLRLYTSEFRPSSEGLGKPASGARQKSDGRCSAVKWCIMRTKSPVRPFPLYDTSRVFRPMLHFMQCRCMCFALKSNNIKSSNDGSWKVNATIKKVTKRSLLAFFLYQ